MEDQSGSRDEYRHPPRRAIPRPVPAAGTGRGRPGPGPGPGPKPDSGSRPGDPDRRELTDRLGLTPAHAAAPAGRPPEGPNGREPAGGGGQTGAEAVFKPQGEKRS
jgi:hypothetical protein